MYQATELTPSLDGWRYKIFGGPTGEVSCFSSEPKQIVELKIKKSLKRMNDELGKMPGEYHRFSLEGSRPTT